MEKIILGPIIGGLSHERVNLWGRAGETGTLYAWLARKKDLSDAIPVGQSNLLAASGFAGMVEIKKLKPETTYYYAISLSKVKPSSFSSFKTFPAPGKTKNFRFAFGSCFRPDHDPAIAGESFEKLGTEKDIAFMLMLGDQIYADEYKYNGLGRVASTLDEYRFVYQKTWSNAHLQNLLAKTPVFMTLDDHEVDDDWHWQDEKRQIANFSGYTKLMRFLKGRPRAERVLPPVSRVRNALQAYWEHQGMHAPQMLLPLEVNKENQFRFHEEDPGSLAYTFYYGAAAFFVMDTRTMRIRNKNARAILGTQQWHALEEWLLDTRDEYPVKFIVSSSAFLYDMWFDLPKDRWNGYPNERNRLLHFLAKHGIENVFLITGDSHEAHATSAELYGPNGKAIPIWEYCSTPFEQTPNKLAKYLGCIPKNAPIKNGKFHFSLGYINYGVVDVEFDKQGKPGIKYTVNYKSKKGWESRSI
jgi:alkaline phosphatase D